MSPPSSAHTAPPPSQNEINLAIATLVIYGSLLPVAVWIAWKHGKQGLTAWPIFVSYFGIVLAGHAYKIARRDDPEVPDIASTMLDAGTIASPTLVLLGVTYEAYDREPYRFPVSANSLTILKKYHCSKIDE